MTRHKPGFLILLTLLFSLIEAGSVAGQPALAPSNSAIDQPALVVGVSQEGLQQISGAAIAAAGWDLATITPANLHLWYAGRELAIEERGLADGRFEPADELRFYALVPGDRWNAEDFYWLTSSATGGLRMASRDLSPAEAPLRSTAIEQGLWLDNRRYDSTLGGPDGDHWFAADLRTGPGQPLASLSLPLTATLPLAVGPLSLTVALAAYTVGPHTLEARVAGATQPITWQGSGDQKLQFNLSQNSAEVSLRLLSGGSTSGVQIDTATWERPITLSFSNQGAIFSGVAGLWRYQLQGVTPSQSLYDISDSWQPKLVAGFGTIFQDGPIAQRYLLSGPGTLHEPNLRAYQPSSLPTPAQVLYIAPSSLQADLAPLLAHRRSQGYSVSLVDVQQLYDHWSYGAIDPEAIRSFLRYAAATWPTPPAYVTLVGDGTSDPRNYTGRNNITFIPPYLAPVDPWLGEAACESCFARFDSVDPLADPLADLAIGRLPVKSGPELAALVQKILGYERAAPGGVWRSRQVILADNGYEADGKPDPAGDFAAQGDRAMSFQPPGVSFTRVYYDPWQRDWQGRPLNEPWREADAGEARAATLAALSEGAALVTFLGHSHQWQWASTDTSVGGALLGLNEVDTLTNGDRLPIVLTMTCLSSAFQQPAYSGTTIDERLLLHPGGGAIAVWGPTGLGVAYGHEALQRGFMAALWQAAPSSPPIGDLVAAGYQELYEDGNSRSTLYTFALLGDPLTPARVATGWRIELPIVVR